MAPSQYGEADFHLDNTVLYIVLVILVLLLVLVLDIDQNMLLYLVYYGYLFSIVLPRLVYTYLPWVEASGCNPIEFMHVGSICAN